MLSVLCLILVLIYLYRNHLYNKLDRNKLSHSSYYDVTYGGERKCSGEVLRLSLIHIYSARKCLLLKPVRAELNS